MVADINGFDMHCETAAEGEPLLWLHGFMGAGADWRYVFPQPPAGFHIIAPLCSDSWAWTGSRQSA